MKWLNNLSNTCVRISRAETFPAHQLVVHTNSVAHRWMLLLSHRSVSAWFVKVMWAHHGQSLLEGNRSTSRFANAVHTRNCGKHRGNRSDENSQ